MTPNPLMTAIRPFHPSRHAGMWNCKSFSSSALVDTPYHVSFNSRMNCWVQLQCRPGLDYLEWRRRIRIHYVGTLVPTRRNLPLMFPSPHRGEDFVVQHGG